MPAIDAVGSLALIGTMSLCAKENPNKHINMINMRSISDRGYRTVSGRYTQSEGQAHKSVCLVLIADFRFIGNENGDMPQTQCNAANWFAAGQGSVWQSLPLVCNDGIRTTTGTTLTHTLSICTAQNWDCVVSFQFTIY